ncbi:MAG: hypothetical protein EBY17_21910 [Acidobacteriia bacterium]|nr:hypothetical protein [Terriglobia bacterium]
MESQQQESGRDLTGGAAPEGGAHDRRALDRQVAGGLAWTVGAKLATQLLTWGSLLVVVRHLTKADYGIGEMAGVLYVVSNVAAEFGVAGAVLNMPELSDRVLAQLHTFSISLSVLVFIVACAVSPSLAAFYHTDAVNLFLANNVNLLLTGFEAVPMGLMGRDMDYRRLSLAEAALVMVQAVVTMVTAILGWGYWALFAGMACGKLTATILVCSWKHVGFAWPNWQEIKAPVRLGRQSAIGRISASLYAFSDGIVVGRMLGSSSLGVYRTAMNLASAPAEKVSTLLMRTASPLFARVQTDHAEVRRYYLMLLEILSLIVMPLMGGLCMVADSAVLVIFGPNWTGATGPLRWLAIFMIIRTVGTLTEQVLNSQRLMSFTMRMSLFNFFLMPAAFATAATWFGTTGVAAAWAALAPLTVAPLVVKLLRTVGLSVGAVLGVVVPALFGTVVMCGAIFGLNHYMTGEWPMAAPWVRLTVDTVFGAVVYVSLTLGLFGDRIQRYVRFLKSMKSA